MAEYRQTYCKMWSDGWFSELLLDEKLLWSYFFTNEHTSVAGIYEISLKTMAFETGIQQERVEEILEKFKKKCRYEDGILWVFNMPKYQGANSSPKVLIRIRKDVLGLPESQIKRDYMKLYSIDMVSIPVPKNDSDTDTDTEKDKDTEKETDTEGVAVVKPPKSNIFTLYENNIGMMSPMIADKLKLIEDEFPPGWIQRAFEIAVENNARNLNYIRAILDRWRSAGYDGDRKNGKSPHPDTKNVIDELIEEMIDGENP